MKILLKDGRLIDPAGGTDRHADILVVNGTIEKISAKISASKDIELVNLSGCVVAPGFIDMHTHLRDPGFEYKETLESGCAAAASGGFTAVCCMPNTSPSIDNGGIVREIIERACRSGVTDVHPVGTVTKGREGKELAPMIELSEAGAVGFSDDGSPVSDAEIMRRALEYAHMIGKPVIQHAEERDLSRGGAMNEGAVSTALGLPAIPGVAEVTMIARDIQLAEFCGSQYHVAHISTARSVELVRSARARGLRVSCEVTPHHFTLTDEAVRTFDTNTKMNPPLRTRDDVEAMKEGLRDGTIEVIATDHAPHTYDEKQVEFVDAPFGIVGLETAVGLAMKLVSDGYLTLPQLIEKFSTNPRAILHLPAIRIAEGERAILTFFDPEKEWKVDVRSFRSKSKNSPFDGWAMVGKAIGVFNRGKVALSD